MTDTTTEQPKAEIVAAPKSGFARASQETKEMLEGYRPQLLAALPKHISVDRMIRIALTEGQRPEIMKCHRGSFLAAVLQACQLGLELGMGLGHAYLVPFSNWKTKRDEVQLIPGYRGLIHLIRQSGMIEKFEARVVYARDTFDLSYGLADTLIHRPYIERGRKSKKAPGPGAVIGAYAIARFKGGEPISEWMPVLTLDAIRARSKASAKGPWATDYEEMCRKTVAKRLAKWCPMSPEVAKAIDLDNKHEAGEAQDLPVDVTALPEIALIETPDPVVETYGVGGEEPEEAATEVEATVSAPEPEGTDKTGETEIPQGAPEDTLGPPNWAERAPAEDKSRENRFANLLASMESEPSEFRELEVWYYKALTAAGKSKPWIAEVEALFKKMQKRFPRPKE